MVIDRPVYGQPPYLCRFLRQHLARVTLPGRAEPLIPATLDHGTGRALMK
jgi:hypothetical protein